jgi:zinc/manganese transport system substrate-binding protein
MHHLFHRSLALVAALLALSATPADAALRVFACEPEWGALARRSAASWSTSGRDQRAQDPHQIRPSRA